ncbi:MAG: thymidine phosphorylase, partial [Spirochaetaceae bacterium]|nr:thymidine phosphorylase [Spirochaetaceae bacterium]
GYLKIDAFKAGLAGVTLGVGRNRTEDAVCPDAGFILHKKEGDSVKKGELLMEVFGKDEECFTSALPALEKAFSYEKNSISKDELIFKQIS